jgi:hypothetical protein
VAETVVPTRPVTAAIIAHLASIGVSVGDGRAPAGASPAFPYVVVYPLDAQDRSGPMSDGQADVTHVQQTTTVGVTQEQCQTLLDNVRARMRDDTLAVAGRIVHLVEVEEGDGVERDDDESPPLFYCVDIYSILTGPSDGGFSDGFDEGFDI